MTSVITTLRVTVTNNNHRSLTITSSVGSLMISHITLPWPVIYLYLYIWDPPETIQYWVGNPEAIVQPAWWRQLVPPQWYPSYPLLFYFQFYNYTLLMGSVFPHSRYLYICCMLINKVYTCDVPLKSLCNWYWHWCESSDVTRECTGP